MYMCVCVHPLIKTLVIIQNEISNWILNPGTTGLHFQCKLKMDHSGCFILRASSIESGKLLEVIAIILARDDTDLDQSGKGRGTET